MIKVTILGNGNLATHLTRVFIKKKEIDLVQVYSRNIEKMKHLSEKVSITDNLLDLKDADVYIIAISDNSIAEFSSQLNLKGKFVVHTSGSITMDTLKGDFSRGVFYPLQTFTKGKKIKFKSIPICIEASNEDDLIILEKLAREVSNDVRRITSLEREKLHLAAVFVNNFVNHMYQKANEICDDNYLPFDMLYPLIKETAKKIESISPMDAQTGPAKRNDSKTIEKHLEQLNSSQKEIYTTLTKSITNSFTTK
jgi:predicted short-subunit dehydrogenase-like oxidoreductase (DUF2520 family)